MKQEYLKSTLHYDEQTGVFTWLVRQNVPKWWNTKYAGKPAGWLSNEFYRMIDIDSEPYKAADLAWLYMTGERATNQIDHKNGNSSDDRWRNLRAAEPCQNSWNRGMRSDNTSGYKGVTAYRNTGKWKASITVRAKHIFLGIFDDPAEAGAAYTAAAAHLHGEFARVVYFPARDG